MRYRQLVFPVLLIALFAATLQTIAQSESANAVASFKKYVSDFEESYKTDGREQVVQSVADAGTARHRHTYAYSDGAWVTQSRQNNPSYAFPKDKWYECRPRDGCWEVK
jgi:hypothetical protein